MKHFNIFNFTSLLNKLKSKDLDKDHLDVIKLKYAFLTKVYESEMKRKEYVENKATKIVSSLSLLVAFLVFLLGVVSGKEKISDYNIIFTLIGICLYFLSCIICLAISVNVQGYEKPYIEDISGVNSIKYFYMRLTRCFKYYIKANHNVINKKVKSVNYAQSCFIGMLILVLYMLIQIFIFPIFKFNSILKICITVIAIVISLIVSFKFKTPIRKNSYKFII